MPETIVKFHHHVDLAGNELRNALAHRVVGLPPPTVERAGWIVFNAVDARLYYCTGTAWELRATDADRLGGQPPAYYLDRTNHTGQTPASAVSGLPEALASVPLDTLAPPTGPVDLGQQELVNGRPATAPNSIPTWGQVSDLVSAGTFRHTRVASAADVAVGTTGAGAVMDGVTLALGDRVLLKDQTNAVQNGVYVVGATALTRSTDADTAAELPPGAIMVVDEGLANADRMWMVTSAPGYVVDVDPLTFSPFGAAPNPYLAGNGITIVNNTVSADPGPGIVVTASGIALDPTILPGLDNRITGLDTRLTGLEDERGNPDGTATLDAAGLVPATQLPFGTTPGTVAAGDDPRFTDARTPTAHAATHAAGGTDPLTPAAIDALPTAAVGAPGGVAPLDTAAVVPIGNLPVGTTPGTVAAGDDPGLTGPRPPLPHAATHATGGTDPIAPASIGAIPTTAIGSTGGVAPLDGTTRVPIGNLPVGGTVGTVAAGDDPRFTDARTPTAHAVTHHTDGSDPLTAADVDAVPAATVGAPDGVASLGPTGTVPLDQLTKVWTIVDSLPAAPPAQLDDMVLLSTDRIVYRYNGTEWVGVLQVLRGAGYARYQQRTTQSVASHTWVGMNYDTALNTTPDITQDLPAREYVINRAGTWRISGVAIYSGHTAGTVRIFNIVNQTDPSNGPVVINSQPPCAWGNAIVSTATLRLAAGVRIAPFLWHDAGIALGTWPGVAGSEISFFWEGP